MASLQPVVGALQRLLPLTWAERQRILIRIDAGLGDDANLSGPLPWGYQVRAKGYSGKRAVAYVRRLAPTACWKLHPGGAGWRGRLCK